MPKNYLEHSKRKEKEKDRIDDTGKGNEEKKYTQHTYIAYESLKAHLN